eukprot:jgi/Botrbrau1/20358/Bobra.0006s0023.1
MHGTLEPAGCLQLQRSKGNPFPIARVTPLLEIGPPLPIRHAHSQHRYILLDMNHVLTTSCAKWFISCWHTYCNC